MQKDSSIRPALQDLQGRWVDLYAILEIPEDSDTATIRKRLSTCYAQASSNAQHRDITLRFYNQRLLEEILPQGLRILLSPTLRGEYDALRLQHLGQNADAIDYATFVGHIYELTPGAGEGDEQEMALAVDRQPPAAPAAVPKAQDAFRLPWEQEEEPAVMAAAKVRHEGDSYFSSEGSANATPVAVAQTHPGAQIESPAQADGAVQTAQPVAVAPTPPITAPVAAAKAAPAAEQVSRPLPAPTSGVIQDEIATLHSMPVRRRYVERFVVEDEPPPAPLLQVDPHCLSEMSRMLLVAMVGGALSFYIQMAPVNNVVQEAPPQVGHSHVVRAPERKSHANFKASA